MTTSTTTRNLLATGALAALLLTGACASDDTLSSPGSAGDHAVPEFPAADMNAEDGAGAPYEASDDAPLSRLQSEAEEEAADARVADEALEQAVISTGTVSLEADDVAATRFEVQKVLDTHRGTIVRQETTTGDDGAMATARLVLRIPSDDFTAATAALEGVATLLASTYGSEDVTTEVIDVEARLRAQEQSVARIEALLAEAVDLREVMAIERELARRQAELDSLKSRQKWLADQTGMATVTVHIQRPGEKDPEKEREGLIGGFLDGWDAFVASVAGVATAAGFVLPWLAVLGVVGLVLWAAIRSRSRRRASGGPAAGDAAGTETTADDATDADEQ